MAGKARRADGRCQRCREPFGEGARCQECGVHEDRPVMSMNSSRRKGRIGGKRGRNSGKVSQHGKK
jgi:hypothetical protein